MNLFNLGATICLVAVLVMMIAVSVLTLSSEMYEDPYHDYDDQETDTFKDKCITNSLKYGLVFFLIGGYIFALSCYLKGFHLFSICLCLAPIYIFRENISNRIFDYKNKKNESLINKEFSQDVFWNNENIIQVKLDGTHTKINYKNIISVKIVKTYEAPYSLTWFIEDDVLNTHNTIHIMNDLQPKFKDLVTNILSKKLEGYQVLQNYETQAIKQIMGTETHQLYLWKRNDAEEVSQKKWQILKTELDIKNVQILDEINGTNKWWRKLIRRLKPKK